jgi:hypothetical protein
MPVEQSNTFSLESAGTKGIVMETYIYHHALKISSIRKQGRRIHASNEKALCKAP